MTEVLLQYWPIFITSGGALIWFIRLEGKVDHNHELMNRNRESVVSVSGDTKGVLDRIARIETKIDLLISTLDNNKK